MGQSKEGWAVKNTLGSADFMSKTEIVDTLICRFELIFLTADNYLQMII